MKQDKVVKLISRDLPQHTEVSFDSSGSKVVKALSNLAVLQTYTNGGEDLTFVHWPLQSILELRFNYDNLV